MSQVGKQVEVLCTDGGEVVVADVQAVQVGQTDQVQLPQPTQGQTEVNQHGVVGHVLQSHPATGSLQIT